MTRGRRKPVPREENLKEGKKLGSTSPTRWGTMKKLKEK
jgi:hypothetical protein